MKLSKDQVAACGREQYVLRTGDWRSQRPVLKPSRCQFCGQCWLVCPTGSVSLEGGAVRIDLEYCKGCGICAEECTFGAIVMQRELGG